MNITLYVSAAKPRELAIAAALRAGFEAHGDAVRTVATADYDGPLDGAQMGVMIGVKGRRIFDEHIKAGRHALLVDKSYFGRTEYLRLSLDAFQPRYAHARPRPEDRLERMRVSWHKARPGGREKYVLYAGSSQKYCDWHGLGDATAYAQGICHRINKLFGTGNSTPGTREVLYRPKPSWVAGHPGDARPIDGTRFSGPEVKLGALLADCHAVVTHGSNAAVEAIVAGVPVVVVSEGACAAEPVAERDFERLKHPRFPGDAARRQWAANLAYCQFALDEMESGLAWSTLIPHTFKAMEGRLAGMSELDRVTEQYRLMHANPKMFRGRLADVFAAEVATLCHETSSQTLLDYGCGKGQQYTVRRQHETHGFPMPHLYDPGHPPIATRPAGTFDGVLCLDVMEHVPEAHVQEVLDDVFGYARRFVFLLVHTAPARKSLPDGRNAHLTCRPEAWWRERIAIALERTTRKPLVVTHFKAEGD